MSRKLCKGHRKIHRLWDKSRNHEQIFDGTREHHTTGIGNTNNA